MAISSRRRLVTLTFAANLCAVLSCGDPKSSADGACGDNVDAPACPPGSPRTGTWSNGSTDPSAIEAFSVVNDVVTLLKTPCGFVPTAEVVVNPDGSFQYSRAGIEVQGTITAAMATGTFKSPTCATATAWSAAHVSNNHQGLVQFNAITPVNAPPANLSSVPAGLVNRWPSAFGLFTVGAPVTVTVTGGTVTFWNNDEGCTGQACTFKATPNYSVIQVSIQ